MHLRASLLAPAGAGTLALHRVRRCYARARLASATAGNARTENTAAPTRAATVLARMCPARRSGGPAHPLERDLVTTQEGGSSPHAAPILPRLPASTRHESMRACWPTSDATKRRRGRTHQPRRRMPLMCAQRTLPLGHEGRRPVDPFQTAGSGPRSGGGGIRTRGRVAPSPVFKTTVGSRKSPANSATRSVVGPSMGPKTETRRGSRRRTAES